MGLTTMNFKIIFEDENILVVDKPAGISVYSEDEKEEGLIKKLSEEKPDLKNVGTEPRYGIIHRLDKDTSGVLLVAKNNQSLEWFQKQFKENKPSKKYTALVIGRIDESEGKIETLIGRSKKDFRKQKVYFPGEPEAKGKREAITEYKILKSFDDYTLIEVYPKTGRMHQIRVHLSYVHHPIVGDDKYGQKNQICPEKLKRQFLHASNLTVLMQDGSKKTFESELPEDLKIVLEKVK